MFNRFLILSETKEALENNFKGLAAFCNNAVLISDKILAISTNLSKYELRRLSAQAGKFIILELSEGLRLNLENKNALRKFIESTKSLDSNVDSLNIILGKISRSGIESIQSQEMALLNKLSYVI